MADYCIRGPLVFQDFLFCKSVKLPCFHHLRMISTIFTIFFVNTCAYTAKVSLIGLTNEFRWLDGTTFTCTRHRTLLTTHSPPYFTDYQVFYNISSYLSPFTFS